MPSVRIKLIGEVAFQNPEGESKGYYWDVPTDQFGVPYLPVTEIVNREGWPTSGTQMGVAHPDGYLGLFRAAQALHDAIPHSSAHVCSYFTNDRFVSMSAHRVRSLKAGQNFYASIRFAPEDEDRIVSLLQSVKHLGVIGENVTGAVECSLCCDQESIANSSALSPLCEYHALDYSMMLLTPACFYAPYSEGPLTYVYAPGAVVRRELAKRALDGDTEGLTFTNAYISDGRKRLLPVPICMSVVKLDKEQLRYRLASGKDPLKTEQDTKLSDAFCEGFESHLIRYATPEIQRITSSDGRAYDVLSQGQVLRGTIYGPDTALRKLAAYIAANPLLNLGTLSNEGYGEVLIRTEQLHERPLAAEILARTFDVTCLSDTLIINDDGMPGCDAEDLVGEVERLLGVSGCLRIEGKYTEVQKDFSTNLDWGCDGAVTRCLKAGSVLRLRTTKDEPVDISPILHAFVGERTADGYGEIMAYPARGQYYRLAERIEFPGFSAGDSISMNAGHIGVESRTRKVNIVEIPVSIRTGHIGARMIHTVLTSILKERVKYLAGIDRPAYLNGVAVENLIPSELLDMYRDTYDPAISNGTLVKWYVDGLEEQSDEWDID